MKKILSLFSFYLLTMGLYAQNPMQMGGNAAQQMNGRFYGKIQDSITGKSIDAASVQLIQNKMDTVTKKRRDFIINGMLTSSNGDFLLTNVPIMGQYKLKVSAIGFQTFETTVSFINMAAMSGGRPSGDMSNMLNMIDKDLGNIKLQLDEKVLANVTVSSSKPLFQLDIDRKIFNVDKNIVSAGGTGVDVMRNIPSLNVDIDGNVTLRNNAPQIFVDGRPTTLTIDQIPADAIESVEIITNPSAKFDASGGTAGILNIVLKKNKKVGYNGSVRSNVDSRGRFGFGGDINVRQNKINVFANTMFNQRRSISTGSTERLTLIGSPNTFMTQSDRSISQGTMGFIRGGMDYFIDNRNTFTINGSYFKGSFEPTTKSNISTDSLFSTIRSSTSYRASETNSNFQNMGTQMSFKHNFPKAGREITADLTFNQRKNENENLVQMDYFNSSNDKISNNQQLQTGNGSANNLVVQTDFVNPINDKTKMEMGIRGAFSKSDNMNDLFNVLSDGTKIYLPSLSLNFNSNESILAAYTTYSKKMKNFGYQLGLRVESSEYNGRLPVKNESFTISYPISLFPSMFLSQKLKNDQDLQLNYSRRINRPNFWQLIPFTDYSDTLNLSRGNPNLIPEFTNSLEMSYAKVFKNKDNFLATLYFKHTDNMITRFQFSETHPINNKPVLINGYINANSSYVTGLELISKNKITKFWELTSNFNLFTSKINIDDPNQAQLDQFVSWFTKINNSFKLPKNFTIQLSGEYQSKTVLPPGGSGGGGGRGGWGGMYGGSTSSQGFTRPVYGVDIAVRYEFLKEKRASLSINMNDIFRTRISSVHSESPFFIQDVDRRRDPQVMRVNFNYRFGKFDANLFKRKNMKGERESMNSMGDGQNF
jgi:outer membrane receptor protein involved in Fe transport